MKRPRLIVFIGFMLLLSNLLTRGPDLIKTMSAPPDKWFTGQASWFDPWDINLYLSAIGWGRRAGILFENLYDTTASIKIPIFFLYTLLGKILAPFDFSNAFIFHLGALIFSLGLGITIWWLLKIFLEEERDQRIAFIIILLGGGLGWLFFPNWVLPDLGLSNFTLARSLSMSAEAASLILLLISIGAFYLSVTRSQNKLLILGTLTCFLMLSFHPYNLIPLTAVFSVFGAYHWLKTGSKNFLKVLTLLVITGWFYYLLLGKELLTNPSFAGQAGQNQPSPSLILMILGWGILSPLILMALWQKSENKATLFLKIWFVAQLTTFYLPFHFQKLLIRGLWVPAVILAVLGFRVLVNKFKWNYAWVVALLLILTTFSTIFMTYQRLFETPQNRWIYLTQAEGQIIEYLKNHEENEEGVLASYRLANIIPAHTSKRVFAGHEFQTPNFGERIFQVNQFYAGKMDEGQAKKFLLEEAKVKWVFWGPDEKAIANLAEIPNKNLLKPILENSIVSLYQILP